MPWSGTAPSQTFSRTDGTRTGDTTWAQAAAAGVNIVTSGHDAHDTDLSDGIEACLKKDGGNTASADIPMGGNTLTNISAAGARTEPARFSDVQDGLGTYIGTVGGTADVITLTPTIAITAYVAGQRFQFLAGGTNTGAVTVNISGVGAKDIKARDASFSALAAGTIISGVLQDILYDGTRFQYIGAGTALTLTGAVTGSGAGSIATTLANDVVTTTKILDANVTNAKLDNMATARFKGRITAGTGVPEDLTATQATAILNAVVGDSGSGGTKGLVPAPASGDAAAGKFLKADATWAAAAPVAGSGISVSSNTVSINTNNAQGVGSYSVLYNNSGGTITNGTTVAGTSLRNEDNTVSQTGTWRNISGRTSAALDTALYIRTA